MFTQINPFAMRGVEFLIFYSIILVITIAAALMVRWWCKQSFASGSMPLVPPKLDPYEAAYLAGGIAHVWLLATTRLMDKGQVQPDPVLNIKPARLATGWTTTSMLPYDKSAHPIERILQQASTTAGRVVPRLLTDSCETLKSMLITQGLLHSASQRAYYNIVVSVPFVLTLCLGAARIVQGTINQKPVNYLLGLVIVGVVSWGVFLAKFPRRTAEGDRLLDQFRSQSPKTELYREASTVTPLAASPFTADAAMLIALWGLPVLVGHPSYREIKSAMGTLESSSGGSSCGTSSCSTSSCGSGGGSSCGGGGGCGGGD